MNKTPIEWCGTLHPDGSYTPGFSSNPVYAVANDTAKRGWHCVKQDASCDGCYAESINRHWGTGLPYIRANDDRVRWVLNEQELRAWEKLNARVAKQGGPPVKVFVGDMLDLFHSGIPDWMLDRIFATAARCKHLILMFLTKRARRMQTVARRVAATYGGPLPNVWWGVSCALQKALRRVEILLATPAAVRFVSYEPALELVDFSAVLSCCPSCGRPRPDAIAASCGYCEGEATWGIAWWLIGGESGSAARPFDPDWARAVIAQCRTWGAAPFVKQLGTVWARQHGERGKGGNPDTWPANLRVREFPVVRATVATVVMQGVVG